MIKETSSRRGPLRLSDGGEFTKEGYKRSSPISSLQYEVANLVRVLFLMICLQLLFCFFS